MGQSLQRGGIGGCFRKPHSFGRPTEAKLKIANAPEHLRVFVALVRQRKDDVVIDLGDGGPVTGEALLAQFVGGNNRVVNLRHFVLHPREKRRAEIEADLGVVADDLFNPFTLTHDAGRGVGCVAFERDALVPIVVRMRRILQLDGFQPGVFTRGLIEVPVNADEFLHVASCFEIQSGGSGRRERRS